MFIFGLLLILFAMPMTSCGMSTLRGKTFLSPRSQSVNAARELVGWYRFINLYSESLYGCVTATPSYGGSFRPERIAQYFFNTDQLVITGSQVANRQPNDLLADYFGLSPLYQSTVRINPHIQTFLVDLDGYVGFENFYLRAHAPAVTTKYSLRLCETIVNFGQSMAYPPLYMDAASIPAPAISWEQAMAGGITFGQVVQGINVGKIVHSKSTTALSEIQVAAGWNMIVRRRGHAGFNIRGSIPTGTRPNGDVLFEPIVGNGHHGELGIGFTGHLLLWEKDCVSTVAFYTDVNLTHLFGTRQRRSFDLCGAPQIPAVDPCNPCQKRLFNCCGSGFFSRYMLVKLFDATGNYTGRTVPLIDLTTLPCRVSAAIQLDLAIMFAAVHRRWSFDLGYDVWLRTHENISLCQQLPFNTLGLKGIQNVESLVGLSNATQSTATIYGNPFAMQAAVEDSNSPVFLMPANLSIQSAQAPLAFTNKVFGHVSYVFDYCRGFEPFLGIGGEVEFEGLNPRNIAEFDHNSVSQWAFWIKGGLAF